VSPTAFMWTVVMLSQLTTLSWSNPLRGPTGTSLVIPRIVLVIGATVSQVKRWSLDRRVKIKAGRRLSSWTDAMVRAAPISPASDAAGRAPHPAPGRRARPVEPAR